MDTDFEILPGAVATASACGKQDILKALAHRFAATYSVDEAAALEALEERERLGSTGFGRSLALPHARMDGLQRPIAALLRLDTPVDFGAADGMPVDLVIGLLSPSNAGVVHLHALAAISRMVRDAEVYERLVAAENSEALFAALTEVMAESTTNGVDGGQDRDAA